MLVQYQFQLKNDTYQMISEKLQKINSKFVGKIISQTYGCEYTCDLLVDASIQII